ncbi:MAG: alpha/beta hydrolase [Deltaproteobacteria bacterium]|nr:alpha/beta hydrolase [Deltaproteobacteria bacterium]
MPYCSVNGIRIYYEISGEGFPMVLIHANPFDRRLWLHQIASFSTYFKVIAVDLRGYGHSDKPTTKTSLSMMAEDVMGVCRQEELKEAVVMGISVGGNVALQLGLDHPDVFKALILVGCSSGPSEHRTRIDGYLNEGVEKYHIQHLRALVSPEFADSTLGKYLLARFTDTDPKLNPESLRQIFEALEVKNLTPRLPELKMPVLLLNGEFDGTLPRTRQMSERISGAVHRVVPGTGHACCLENPMEFDAMVREFLRKHRFMPE